MDATYLQKKLTGHSLHYSEQERAAEVVRVMAEEVRFLQVYRTEVMAQVRAMSPLLEKLDKENGQLIDCLNDCVRLLLGHVSGPAQRDGIIKESIAALGERYSGSDDDEQKADDGTPSR